MRRSSTVAARRKTAVPNAVFVVAAAEQLPEDLAHVADRVTVQFPWGSLLRGLVSGSDDILGPIATAAIGGAMLTALWSIVPRDVASAGVTPIPDQELSRRFRANGFDVTELRPATPEEVRASGSSWGKRLGVDSRRPVSLLRARKR